MAESREPIGLMAAGALAGAISKTATAPLERVKLLLQIQGMRMSPGAPVKYKGIWQTLSVVVKEEGPRALFKGNWPNVLRVIPNYALKFTFNDVFRDIARRPGQEVHQMSFAQLMVAGTVAGLFQMAVTYPIETVRTRMTLSSDLTGGVVYRGVTHCFSLTVKQEGAFALYKGFSVAMFSGAPYVGMQMTFYQMGQNWFAQVGKKLTEDGHVPFWGKMFVGGISGLLAQTIVYPGDTIRRRMQTSGIGGEKKTYTSSWDCIRKTYAREGTRGFFRGTWANSAKALPGAALQFASFDFFKKLFSDKKESIKNV